MIGDPGGGPEIIAGEEAEMRERRSIETVEGIQRVDLQAADKRDGRGIRLGQHGVIPNPILDAGCIRIGLGTGDQFRVGRLVQGGRGQKKPRGVHAGLISDGGEQRPLGANCPVGQRPGDRPGDELQPVEPPVPLEAAKHLAAEAEPKEGAQPEQDNAPEGSHARGGVTVMAMGTSRLAWRATSSSQRSSPAEPGVRVKPSLA